ncbi:endonuclease/exonuclease/phosphatase family protein [Saccharothrix syringae]|uniref:Endonuclease/exonuclease/phosphatase n=1 Tax=Saccharothrix syringae TaxID=103733 RepID=A0A5Q0H335_SACSY|nr:endonuclease/exonuclease/phosphatase family protein [Saccharothrix syringae]QFZ20503.1 endonuclease/exonuclease/phosphatase [Saccharothrix syringae]
MHDVQGAGHRSPLAGQRVTVARGVVVAADARRGVFWLHSVTPDPDPATSEAVQVAVDVPVPHAGDLVRVSGVVQEHRDGGDTPTNANLSVTRIGAPAAVAVVGRHPVPAPVPLGRSGRIPPREVVKDDVVGDVEHSAAFDPDTQGLDFYESLEGMPVRVDEPVAVSPALEFSGGRRVTVVADAGADATTLSGRGALPAREHDPNPERLGLVTGPVPDAIPAGIDVGDRLSPVCGVLDYRYGAYEIVATCSSTRHPAGLVRETARPTGADELAIATFNVENLSAVSPAEKVAEIARTITTHLASPAVVVVEEVQDDDGPADTGVTTAGRTWQSLVDAIAAAGGPRYDFRQIDPLDGTDGGVPGGNIRVGFLFRTDIGLSFVDRPGGTATTPVHVAPDGTLTISPGRLQPDHPAFTDTRKSLAGEFTFRGTRLVVVANHLSSQRGDDPTFGRFQPPRTPSRVPRGEQTAVLGEFARELLDSDPHARLVLAGDFNDTEFSPPLRTLHNLGLTDLPATLPEGERYTYIYQGNAQVLDHILLSPHLAANGYDYDIVHVNAEFADQVSDHDPQLVRLTFP